MLDQAIKQELGRLSLHPVNLTVASLETDRVVLKGSLLAAWDLPTVADAEWLLRVLQALPAASGPKATMEAIRAAHAEHTGS